MSSTVKVDAHRITPDDIAEVLKNRISGRRSAMLTEVIVFPSNTAGRHGKGLAELMKHSGGAKQGIGYGITGCGFAIPTKGMDLSIPLKLETIKGFVDQFINDTSGMTDVWFYVTKIGCGNAGYTPEEMAPMFAPLINKNNYRLPIEFWQVLKNKGLYNDNKYFDRLSERRFIVIAEDTSGELKVGEIATMHKNYDSTGRTGMLNKKYRNLDWFLKYPHLFRELGWWEYRSEWEMPEYLINIHNGKVFKAKTHFSGPKKDGFMPEEDEWEGRLYNDWHPATEYQYNQYHKSTQ